MISYEIVRRTPKIAQNKTKIATKSETDVLTNRKD